MAHAGCRVLPVPATSVGKIHAIPHSPGLRLRGVHRLLPRAPAVERQRPLRQPASARGAGQTTGKGSKDQYASGKGRRRKNSAKTGRGRIPLSDISVGQELEGTVRVVLPSAVLLKCRAETDAYLPDHLMGDFGPASELKQGDQFLTHVQKVDPSQETLWVTMLKGGKPMGGSPRKAVQDSLRPGQVVPGTVKKIVQAKDEEGWVRTTGVFVDIGAQKDVFLESSEGVPQEGKPVVVRILPDGLSEEQIKIRRRIGAVLEGSDQGPSGSPGGVTAAAKTAGVAAVSLTALDQAEEAEEEPNNYEEEEDDPYDKFGYLDEY